MTPVLLIDDDVRLGALVRDYLGKHEVLVTTATDGEQGLRALDHSLPPGRTRFHAVLLDLMLPGIDGLEVCRRIRQNPDHAALPILMLTAKGDDVDKIVGLELGADDYLAKPFNPRELLARLRAVLRRSNRSEGEAPPANGKGRRLRVGDLVLDLDAREVTVAGEAKILTSFEFELLAALMRAAGRVLSREHLLEVLKGEEFDSFDRSIDVHISKLRSKLEPDPRNPRYLKTVRGVGYVCARSGEEGGP